MKKTLLPMVLTLLTLSLGCDAQQPNDRSYHLALQVEAAEESALTQTAGDIVQRLQSLHIEDPWMSIDTEHGIIFLELPSPQDRKEFRDALAQDENLGPLTNPVKVLGDAVYGADGKCLDSTGESILTGLALNLKSGAVLQALDSTMYYLEELDGWEDDLSGMQIKLTYESMEMEQVTQKATQDENGAWSQGSAEDNYAMVIKGWQLLESRSPCQPGNQE